MLASIVAKWPWDLGIAPDAKNDKAEFYIQKQKRRRRKSEDTKSDFSGIKRERKT